MWGKAFSPYRSQDVLQSRLRQNVLIPELRALFVPLWQLLRCALHLGQTLEVYRSWMYHAPCPKRISRSRICAVGTLGPPLGKEEE